MDYTKKDFDLIHDIAPGKHFYQFYKSPEDLLRVLIPYWEAGVRKNNFCLWIIPIFMNVEEASEVLRPHIRNIDELLRTRKFEIIPHAEWYGDGEIFDGDMTTHRYMSKIKEAISRGFSVIRAAGDSSGFKPHLWSDLQEYERKGQAQIHMIPCIALCSYPLHQLRLQQTKDVLDSHHGVLVAKV